MSSVPMPMLVPIAFDALAYVKELEEAGFTRAQAEAQTRILRAQAEAQARILREQAEAQARKDEARDAALKETLSQFDEASRKELATKGDVQDTRLEIEKVRADLRETELRLQREIEMVRAEIKSTELRLLKWQIGIGSALGIFMLAGFGALAAIIAKGFGWLSF